MNHPDPTDGPALGGGGSASASASGDGGRRGQVPAEAPPIPGQVDPSKPEIVLPEGIQDDGRMRSRSGPQAPARSRRSTDPADPRHVLDFLLGP